MQVSDVMHRGVPMCSPAAPVREAARLMSREHVHCVLVHDESLGDEGFCGVVTELGVAEAASRGRVREAAETWAVPVALVAEESTLETAMRRMTERGAPDLVVVDRLTARPSGVISRIDAANALLLSEQEARAA